MLKPVNPTEMPKCRGKGCTEKSDFVERLLAPQWPQRPAWPPWDDDSEPKSVQFERTPHQHFNMHTVLTWRYESFLSLVSLFFKWLICLHVDLEQCVRASRLQQLWYAVLQLSMWLIHSPKMPQAFSSG